MSSACHRRSSPSTTLAQTGSSTSPGASCPSSRSGWAGRQAISSASRPSARRSSTSWSWPVRLTCPPSAPRSRRPVPASAGSTDPMLVGIDHVVLATDDLDPTAGDLERRVGLATTDGGRHEALGTVNRLVWLGDSYLELIGVFDRDLAARSWLGQPVMAALERGGGLVTWAIAVDDLDGAIRWAPPDGGLVGPVDGERRRPAGRFVRWRLARPEPIGPALPFLIEHDLTAAEWTPDERSTRATAEHPI